MKRKLLIHYLFFFSFFIFVAMRRGFFSLGSIPFWVGGLIGTLLPDLDHVFYSFVYKDKSVSFLSFKSLLYQKKYLSAFYSILEKSDTSEVSAFHSFSFQLLFFVLTFWIVTSSSSVFAVGLVMAFTLHLLVDQLNDLLSKGNLGSWYSGFFNLEIPEDKHVFYWFAILVLFILVSFVF